MSVAILLREIVFFAKRFLILDRAQSKCMRNFTIKNVQMFL